MQFKKIIKKGLILLSKLTFEECQNAIVIFSLGLSRYIVVELNFRCRKNIPYKLSQQQSMVFFTHSSSMHLSFGHTGPRIFVILQATHM